ncbi:MAG: T9SS C-terminal target domain-containing protein [Bacteroidota bacterium]
MKQVILFGLSSLFALQLEAQSFAPAPGFPGTTAVHKDSSAIVFWAWQIDLQRGYLDISDKSLGYASYGLPGNGMYEAEGNPFDVVSLGDSGVAVLTFPYPVSNGEGFDFAVFENGFTDNYLELAFVEVSSDGMNYVRFPAISELQDSAQMGNYEFWDCAFVNNLAGKYRQGYGTPFDLQELAGSGIDINNITHVKIVDVIGSIDPAYGSFDSQNHIINDPWPSAFESGGFDLDGIAVMHSVELGIMEEKMPFTLFENGEALQISASEEFKCKLISTDGKILLEAASADQKISFLKRREPQLVFLVLSFDEKQKTVKIFY